MRPLAIINAKGATSEIVGRCCWAY